MKSFKVIVSLLLILVLTLTCAFAANGKGNNGFKTGNLTGKSTEAKAKIATKFLEKETGKAFKVRTSNKDNLGLTTIRTQQYFNDVPVYGFDQIVNIAEDGVVKSQIGFVAEGLEKQLSEMKKSVSPKQAIKIAEKELTFNPQYDVDPTADLYVYLLDDKAYYVYLVELAFLYPEAGRWNYFVDIATGKVIDKFNRLTTKGKPSASYNPANTMVATGLTTNGASKSFNINAHTDGQYYMVDLTRGGGIYTYDGLHRSKTGSSVFKGTDASFTSDNDRAGVDSQYFMAQCYDFYKEVFGRNSFDDNGAQIKSTVHYKSNYDNAYWYNGEFVFGDGDGVTTKPYCAGLDVVGHEYTHAVTEYTANLIYRDESGAMNEAMSEIMGTAMEHYFEANPDWLGAEDVMIKGGALNSLEDPKAYGHPDRVADMYTGTGDNGGVHINSHMICKTAHLIAEGGTHYGVTVQGHGVDTMQRIFYRALTTYMTASTNFAQGKQACIQAANELYGVGSAQSISVEKAFTSIGVN